MEQVSEVIQVEQGVGRAQVDREVVVRKEASKVVTSPDCIQQVEKHLLRCWPIQKGEWYIPLSISCHFISVNIF